MKSFASKGLAALVTQKRKEPPRQARSPKGRGLDTDSDGTKRRLPRVKRHHTRVTTTRTSSIEALVIQPSPRRRQKPTLDKAAHLIRPGRSLAIQPSLSDESDNCSMTVVAKDVVEEEKEEVIGREDSYTSESSESGFTSVIVKLISEDLYSSNKRTVHGALSSLADLCMEAIETFMLTAADRRRRLFEAGAHLAAIETMRRFPNTASIQAEACRVLLNMSYAQVETQRTIGDMGGMVLVLTAMFLHPKHRSLQYHGMAALVNLIAYQKDNAVRLSREASGLEVIAKVMDVHIDNVTFQRSGCRAFWNLCRWQECKSRVLESGGFVAVAKALEHHQNNADVQKYGKHAMRLWLAEESKQ